MSGFTQFDYLLNAFEAASQSDNPFAHGYGAKRVALYAYVRDLEAKAALSPPAFAQPPFYIGGPYPDGTYSICELSTGRIVQKLPADELPVLPAGQEPVAWRGKIEGRDWWTYFERESRLLEGETAEPLFAHPAQHQQDALDARRWIGTAFAELDGVETDDENNCLKAAISALKKADAALSGEGGKQ